MERGSRRREGVRADVEGLRALAILGVVLFHTRLGVLPGGFVGVDVFFVLSGFLITGLLWRDLERSGRIGFAAFYARRVRRLLPAAVLVLVVTVVAATHLLPPLRAGAVVRDAVAAAIYVANYRFAVEQTDYLAFPSAPSPVEHYWSLGVEEQFYLFWPLLLALVVVRRRRRRPAAPARGVALAVVGVVAAASFALSSWLTSVAQPWAFFSLPSRAWELAAGALVALALPALTRLPRRVAVVLGWSGLTAVGLSFLAIRPGVAFPGLVAAVPVVGTVSVLIAGVTAGNAGPVRLLRLRPLQVIARASYSWYLWHWPPLVLVPVVLGRELSPAWTLVVCVATLAAALVTVVVVEDPIRFSRPLTLRPAASLATGAALTSVAVVTSLVTASLVPPVAGHGVAAAAVQLPAARPAAVRSRGVSAAVSPLEARVSSAVAAGVRIRAVPSNLDPSLARASADEALPFLDGCHLSFTASVSGTCAYGDRSSPTRVVLFGDSHATQWFPALERAAQARHWRLEVLAKSTCPPVLVPIVSPVLGRTYRECERWRESVLARVAAERPALVVLGTARHYGPMYHFAVYGPQWLGGLRDMARRLRATGTRVVVLGPTPKPAVNVPECLSEHVSDARACTGPVAALVNRVGMRGERAAVEAAGGRYVDVTPWICTATTCAVIVGNLLVWRDDNHLSTTYPRWLAPLVAETLAPTGS